MTESKEMSKARDTLYTVTMTEHLHAVSMYAYGLDCDGLTEDECRELEMLCDKAENALVEWFAKEWCK